MAQPSWPVGLVQTEDGRTVPFVVFRVPEGQVKPSRERRNYAVSHSLCGMCGEPLTHHSAFVGDERAARLRRYTLPGMHETCAEYATSVWPELFVCDGGAHVMLIANGYKVAVLHGQSGSDRWCVRPSPALRTRRLSS